MTREEEIKKLIEIAKQKSKDRNFEFTEDEVVNLPFNGSYEYGFASGAMWQKRQMIEKACEWIKKLMIASGNYDDYDIQENLRDFKKAMKEE